MSSRPVFTSEHRQQAGDSADRLQILYPLHHASEPEPAGSRVTPQPMNPAGDSGTQPRVSTACWWVTPLSLTLSTASSLSPVRGSRSPSSSPSHSPPCGGSAANQHLRCVRAPTPPRSRRETQQLGKEPWL